MTPTPHRQVPEALRLAEEISNLVCSSEAAAKTIAAAADELCRLHVENASLRVQQLRIEQAAPKAAPHLPERDATLPAERQGLFRKFVVGRVDGSDKPGGKHHGCTYFVLDVDHDPCARPALAAYAAACEGTHPTLAADLRTKWGVVPAPQPAPAPLSDDVAQKTWALIDELEKMRSASRDDEDWITLNARDSELRAALAAHGGKEGGAA